MLAPTADVEIGTHDSLVVLAGAAPDVDRIGDGPEPAAISVEADVDPLSVVVIGWSRAGPGAIGRLAEYLPEGSTVNVLADVSLLADGQPEWTWSIPGSFRPTKHDPEQVLSAIEEVDADVVAVLGYADKLTEDEADALTLLTLLTFEQARRDGEVGSFRTVAHLFDQDIAEMVVHTGPLDFVVTDALASRMLVQAARHRQLAGVFDDLFDAAGPIVDSLPVASGSHQYGVLAASMVAGGVIPIGVVIGDQVRLNPMLDSTLELGPDDRVVVIHRAGGS